MANRVNIHTTKNIKVVGYLGKLDNNLIGVITFQQTFRDYPDSWLVVKPIKREGHLISKMMVLRNYREKKDAFKEARRRKREGEDIAVICTIETAEDARQSVMFDYNRRNVPDDISPREYALMFQLYYGLAVPEEYLVDDDD